MPTITVQVPDELKKRMDAQETTNWSAVARIAFEKELSKAKLYDLLEEAAKNSALTEADAKKLGDEVNRKVSERYRKIFEKQNGTKIKKK